MNGKTKDDLVPAHSMEANGSGELLSMYNMISGFRDEDGMCYIGISFAVEHLYEYGSAHQNEAKKVIKLTKIEALHVANRIEEMDGGDTYFTNNRVFEKIDVDSGNANARVIYNMPGNNGDGNFYIHSEQIRRVANLPIPGEEDE